MARLPLTPSFRLLMLRLQDAAGINGNVAFPRSLVTILNAPCVDVMMALALREEVVWSPGQRVKWAEQVAAPLRSQRGVDEIGYSLAAIMAGVDALARKEGALAVGEEHFAGWIAAEPSRANSFREYGVDVTKLRSMLRELECARSTYVGPVDQEAGWLFVDANVFLHCRFFIEVDWHAAFGFKRAVVVVPMIVLRELDVMKMNPSKYKEHLRDRARKTLARFDQIMGDGAAQEPIEFRDRNRLLLVYPEPSFFPPPLDPHVADDRMICSVREFAAAHPGAQVKVVSNDTPLRHKARSFGLIAPHLPSSVLDSQPESPPADTRT